MRATEIIRGVLDLIASAFAQMSTEPVEVKSVSMYTNYGAR